MKKFCFLSTLFLLAMLFNGCVLTPHTDHPVSTYDLQVAAPVIPQDFFIISAVSNQTPARNKFYYRSGNTVQFDHYRNWVQPPEMLLERFLLKKFPYRSNGEKNPIEVKLSIIGFEFDLTRSEAVLSLNYTLRNITQKNQGNITIREKFTPTADAMVAAMDKAVAAAAEKLEMELNKFQNQK